MISYSKQFATHLIAFGLYAMILQIITGKLNLHPIQGGIIFLIIVAIHCIATIIYFIKKKLNWMDLVINLFFIIISWFCIYIIQRLL